jgi:perosamine synthetase
MRVPYFAPTWGRQEEAAVRRALRSGWITMGQEVLQFEHELANHVGARYAVAVNSATAALHLSLLAAGVQQGEPVVVPVYTFTASAGAILQAGGRPVFADIDSATLNMDPESAAFVAPRRVAAWMTVDMAGLPAAYAPIRQLAKRHGGAIVADAAHSLGAAVGKTAVGSLADFTCFSFYANKNLTTAEGGMVTTRNRAADDQMRRLRLHGMSRDAWKRYDKHGSWYYEIDRHGFKYNQNDILAALGRAQLARFEVMQKKRARAAAWYDEGLSETDEIIRAPRQRGRTHAWHLYVVRLRGRHSRRRNAVIEYLRHKGIDTSVHFIPLCLHPFWKRTFKLKPSDYPHAMAAYRGAISLPMHPGLSRAQCGHVTKTLKDALVRA